MNEINVKIIFTDLDRTLLKDDNTFSDRNLKALVDLQKNKIITVIATGRNIFSSERVLPADLPINYLMFSAGCGIIEWKDRKLIYENHLEENQIQKISKVLIKHDTDFMIHKPIPDNHCFDYVKNTESNPDFARRLRIYESFARKLEKLPANASQFIAILKPDQTEKFAAIKEELDFVKVIRATSPIDHRSIWLEVFPQGVSKGHTAEWLCQKLNIEAKHTLGIGNDFNDLDLLEFTKYSCVVANAPAELKKVFKVIDSNEDNGFAKCMEKIIKDS